MDLHQNIVENIGRVAEEETPGHYSRQRRDGPWKQDHCARNAAPPLLLMQYQCGDQSNGHLEEKSDDRESERPPKRVPEKFSAEDLFVIAETDEAVVLNGELFIVAAEPESIKRRIADKADHDRQCRYD